MKRRGPSRFGEKSLFFLALVAASIFSSLESPSPLNWLLLRRLVFVFAPVQESACTNINPLEGKSCRQDSGPF